MTGPELFASLANRDPIWTFSLERLLTDPRAFGLTTASPVQRAICRILDGSPLAELAANRDVITALGGKAAVTNLPATRPVELVLLAGIRSGKSLLDVACGVRSALTCDVSRLGPGEVPRVSIVATKLDVAKATWEHAAGRILASRELSALLIEEPKTDSLRLRHPTGRPVEIRIVAGGRAAHSLVARWAAGVIFDEAPRMLGQDEGVVNLDHARIAVAGRLLPGAQILMSGSSWAPFGPVYELVHEHHGKPSQAIVVVRATGPMMNPREWTPEKCEELRKRNPQAYRVDVLTEFLDPEQSLFTADQLESCARDDDADIHAGDGRFYVAAIDPATRGNAWTLVVLSNAGGGTVEVALCRQWKGSAAAPLNARDTLSEIAALVAPYRIAAVESDQWAADPLKEIAVSVGLFLRTHSVTSPVRVENFERMRVLVEAKRLSLPRNADLLRDLASVRKRVTAQGLSIDLPHTADGRHADYAAALSIAMAQPLPEPDVVKSYATDTERKAAEWRESIRESDEKWRRNQDDENWSGFGPE